jgi:hypothetical protein
MERNSRSRITEQKLFAATDDEEALELEKDSGLTDRDKAFLRALSVCGVLRIEQVQKHYGNVSQYHKRRVERFSAAGYIKRRAGYIEITIKGCRAAGIEEKPLRVQKWRREHKAKIADLIYEMPEWKVTIGTEIKRQKELNPGMRIGAVISKDSSEYAVYLLSENPLPLTVGIIWHEIQKLSEININRAVIFCPTPAAMTVFTEQLSQAERRLQEILVLPHPDGVHVLNRVNQESFKNLIVGKLPGLLPANRVYVDYQWQGYYVCNLITNDLIKRRHLKNYFESIINLENRPVIIICMSNQLFFYRRLYPEASFLVLSDDLSKILELNKGGECHEPVASSGP